MGGQNRKIFFISFTQNLIEYIAGHSSTKADLDYSFKGAIHLPKGWPRSDADFKKGELVDGRSQKLEL